MRELSISTSPRMTWLWADDAAAADAVRQALTARAHVWEPGYRGRQEVPLVTDVGTGVEAADYLQSLRDAGYTFTWHPDQHPLNRDDTLYGVPVRV